MNKFSLFRKNLMAQEELPSTLLGKRRGEATFGGKKVQIKCALPNADFESGILNIGELEELECETPLEEKINAYGLIKSNKKPIVIATGNGKLVLVISSDAIKGEISPDSLNEEDVEKLKAAIDLHDAFHGTNFEKIVRVNTDDPEFLIFFGHLNFIVYSVPQYSERRGVPFIHEARDRGDHVPPAKDKPIVCVSPKRDFLVMSGTQFEFTERGIIG